MNPQDPRIDYTTGTFRVTLHGERAKRRGDTIIVTDELAWHFDEPTILKALYVYGEVRIRDWRWLWLRRKSIMVGPKVVPL